MQRPERAEANVIRTTTCVALAACIAAPALAQGDLPGARDYFISCRPCHGITDPDGTAIMLGSGLGPDLFGIIGRPAGQQAGYDYSDALRRAAEMGLVWSEQNIIDYIAGPRSFLREHIGDPDAVIDMNYSFTRDTEAIIDFLRAVQPEPEDQQPEPGDQ
jgi:cytochrome c